MPLYEVLFVVEIVYVLIVTLLMLISIKSRKMTDASNMLIAGLSLIPSMILALISLFINQSEGLEKIFLVFSSFSIPLTFFFVIVIFVQYVNMKEVLKEQDEEH